METTVSLNTDLPDGARIVGVNIKNGVLKITYIIPESEKLSPEELGFKRIETGDLRPEEFLGYNTFSLAQRRLKEQIIKAIYNNKKKGFYVPLYEPTSLNGKLQFVSGLLPNVSSNVNHWQKLATDFCPTYNSRLANIDEYYLLLARLLKDKKLVFSERDCLQQIADDSSMVGNYWNTFQSSRKIEPTGHRHMGLEIWGFVGNTFKVLLNPDGFYYAGGCYLNCGDEYPLASVKPISEIPEGMKEYAVGLVVLEDCY